MGYAFTTNEELQGWRGDLAANIAEFKAKWRGLEAERLAKVRLLAVADAGSLRAARWKPKDGRGVVVDGNQWGGNTLRSKLMEIEFQEEILEAQVIELEAQLAELPETLEEKVE